MAPDTTVLQPGVDAIASGASSSKRWTFSNAPLGSGESGCSETCSEETCSEEACSEVIPQPVPATMHHTVISKIEHGLCIIILLLAPVNGPLPASASIASELGPKQGRPQRNNPGGRVPHPPGRGHYFTWSRITKLRALRSINAQVPGRVGPLADLHPPGMGGARRRVTMAAGSRVVATGGR